MKRILASIALVAGLTGAVAVAAAPSASAAICVRVNITIGTTGPIGTGPVPICLG